MINFIKNIFKNEDNSPEELSDEIHQKIQSLCKQGDGLVESKLFAEGIKIYWQAWDLLPQPQEQWDAATWVLVAIGDANFLSGDYEAGRDNLSNAMHCPNAIGNPFIHMRLGQCQLELKNKERALDELIRAYMGGGTDIFSSEAPKYLQLLKDNLDAPDGGW